jgi:anaerobic sulfite reductase subunit C
MRWTSDAEAAIKKVPFFVRKKVKARVEKEAMDEGKRSVTLDEVKATQARFLSNMSSEIKGFQVDSCFAQGECPNQANKSERLLKKIEDLFEKEDLLGFLKQSVHEDLKYHHEFRVTFADCPNACSQPQIKDIGIIGAREPVATKENCTLCNACIDACKEDAITIDTKSQKPEIDFELCLGCGKCIDECPTGTISESKKGFRVQLGGKLGRHPKLAVELDGIYSEDETVSIVKRCIDFYKKHSTEGKRFAEILEEEGVDQITTQ